MKKLVILQSLIILVLLSISLTMTNEFKNIVATKQKTITELTQWKSQYQNQRNELQAFLKSDLQQQPQSTIHFDEWKQRNIFVQKINEDSEKKFDDSWSYFLYRKAKEFNIDPYLVYELIKVETGATFDPHTIGPVTKYGQAKGLGQFMASNTAEWVASMAGLDYKGEEMLFDPYYSIELTVVYLDFLYSQYEDWDEALTAYNRGMYGLELYKEQNGHAQSTYALNVLEAQEKYNNY